MPRGDKTGPPRSAGEERWADLSPQARVDTAFAPPAATRRSTLPDNPATRDLAPSADSDGQGGLTQTAKTYHYEIPP